MPFSFLASETGHVHVCGHRGYSLRYPENTLPAFEAAKAAGATTVEIDLVLTADDEPVILHDLSVDRTTDGHGFAADLTLEQVRGLDAGSSFHPRFGQTGIPTLSEVGQRHPLHATGVGRAILLTRDPAWLDEYLREPLEAETRHTITDAAKLREVIAAEAVKGWAVTRQEMTLGNISIAMPLRERPGLPPAAIGIVAHASSADEVRLLPLLRRAAAAIEQRLDGQ